MRVFHCLGYVFTQLVCVTDLDGLLCCAIDECFVNDRLVVGFEFAGTGRDDGLP